MSTQTVSRAVRPGETATLTLSTVALVGYPLLILTYFALYPAYGETSASSVFSSISGNTARTQLADVFGLLGCFVSVPAALALLRLLRPASPRLAGIGASLMIIGWIAVATSVMTDVFAVELGRHEAIFHAVYTNPLVLALDVTASLHIVGGVLIGVALIRTQMIPRALAVATTAAPAVHLASNLAGQLWLDALTWLVTAVAGFAAARVLSRG